MVRGATAELRASQPAHLRLNVGSGLDVLPGFVNLDNSIYLRFSWLSGIGQFFLGSEKAAYLRAARSGRRAGTLRSHDCRNKLPFGDETVAHVLASHILEHVYPDQAHASLRDMYRVLVPGGTLHVIVPDLERLARQYLRDNSDCAADEFIESTIMSHRTRPRFRYRLLEMIGYEGLQHRWMYDTRSMHRMLMAAGFEVVPEIETPSSFVRRTCPVSIHVYGRKPTGVAPDSNQQQVA